jgi:hypothetical protein
MSKHPPHTQSPRSASSGCQILPREENFWKTSGAIRIWHSDAPQCILDIKGSTFQSRMPLGYKGTGFKGLAICQAVRRRGQSILTPWVVCTASFLRRKSTCLNRAASPFLAFMQKRRFSRRRSIVAGRRPGDDDDGDDAVVSRRRLDVIAPPPPLHETREMIAKTQQ